MSKTLIVMALVVIVAAFIVGSAGPTWAAKKHDKCSDAYQTCIGRCDNSDLVGIQYESCIGRCSINFFKCDTSNQSGSNLTPPNPTTPPPKGTSGLNPVHTGGVTDPPKVPPKGTSGVNPVPVGGIKDSGGGNTGPSSGSGTTIYRSKGGNTDADQTGGLSGGAKSEPSHGGGDGSRHRK